MAVERPCRLRRSILSVPGNREKMIEKSRRLPADVVMLDLEDSVPVDQKDEARKLVISALQNGTWRAPTLSVRINPMDSPWAYRDIVDIVEKCGRVLHTVVIPKVEDPCEVKAVDYFIGQIELNCGFPSGRIGLEASVETAKGMILVEDIAVSSRRLETLVFGIADYTSSVGAPAVGVSGHGEAEDFYPGHRWHFPMSRLVMAAKAAGLMAVDAPYGDFKDIEGLRRSCLISRGLGYDGKWAIHPDQLSIINELFAPSPEDVERSLKIVREYEKAREEGRGTCSVDGKMIDGATLRLARQTLEKWKMMESLNRTEG
ncbi:HpcH/HpaI aldolase/citrate lyase family protein [Thermodesulforhabdus norvegica]|uniref:Citrate lyase subunit beta / citryl-CoA lyase n=1 Tax=Thermodesulforhabdus norvegica TaxID=39841 RepID=A0A1I4QL32_9BACT|nr:CoA ester lyase [Thermodesulforhabdus norvegica]SFM40761.1 citrate lyase subunit beta / citryl-CoA lyase [Thermodesulforhabdus norvegica]